MKVTTLQDVKPLPCSATPSEIEFVAFLLRERSGRFHRIFTRWADTPKRSRQKWIDLATFAISQFERVRADRLATIERFNNRRVPNETVHAQ